ncbi:MAG: EamA family transporter [Chloroflexota bacterium]
MRSLSQQSNPTGVWMVLAGATLWGTTGTAQAFAPSGTSPAAVGAVRLAIGGLALLAFALARRSFTSGKPWPRLATGLAAGCMAGYQLCFFAAVSQTGVALGTIVAIGSAPVLAGALGRLAFGEMLDRKWFLATSLAILGCTTLLATGGKIQLDIRGILLALAAGACYATYAVASKQLLQDHTPDAVIAVVFCLAAALLSPVLLTADLKWLAQVRGLVVALHLGLIATAAAYILFTRGLKYIPVANAVTLSLAEPLTAALLGILLLGERLTIPAWLGAGLLLAGLALLSL